MKMVPRDMDVCAIRIHAQYDVRMITFLFILRKIVYFITN